MLITPAQPVRAGRLLPWASFRVQKSLGDAKQKADKRRTQHWKCNVPALQTWMESASTSLDLISEASSLAGLDIRDVDLDSVNVGAISQVVEVSVHQGPVEAMSAMIEADQAWTMDNLVSAPQCATLLLMFARVRHTLRHSLHTVQVQQRLGSACLGPSFPPGIRAPISMLPGAPIVFSGMPPAPCRMPGRCSLPQYSLWQEHHGPVRPRLMLVHLWPLQLGQYICLVTGICLGLSAAGLHAS